jgi:hypothetical protein
MGYVLGGSLIFLGIICGVFASSVLGIAICLCSLLVMPVGVRYTGFLAGRNARLIYLVLIMGIFVCNAVMAVNKLIQGQGSLPQVILAVLMTGGGLFFVGRFLYTDWQHIFSAKKGES